MSHSRRGDRDDAPARADAPVSLASVGAWARRSLPAAHATLEDALRAAADAYADAAAGAP